jgi:sulfide:quinone oxidoreductase
MTSRDPDRFKVLIVGGGFAALETALALRALAEERVDLTVISPNTRFAYRPSATAEPFEARQTAVAYDLGKIALDLSIGHQRGTVVAVAPKQRRLRLDSSVTLDYEALVLAVGAETTIAVPGAMTFRDQRDLERFRTLLDDLAAGAIRRLVFAVPSRDAWSLPLYELALHAALHGARHSLKLEIVLVTPESAPLAVFGAGASKAVAKLLAERDITFVGSSVPLGVRRDGSLEVQHEQPITADRVVALPGLKGTQITGIPVTRSGFVPTDSFGRVEGLSDVYAAGDVTAFPIKQGGLAAQQADLVAHTIASALGAPVKEFHQDRILRARLLHGDGALVLRTELDALGRPMSAGIQHLESRRAPELKVFGQYLTPYLSIYLSRLRAKAEARVTPQEQPTA